MILCATDSGRDDLLEVLALLLVSDPRLELFSFTPSIGVPLLIEVTELGLVATAVEGEIQVVWLSNTTLLFLRFLFPLTCQSI